MSHRLHIIAIRKVDEILSAKQDRSFIQVITPDYTYMPLYVHGSLQFGEHEPVLLD